jgi:hypothetical protein
MYILSFSTCKAQTINIKIKTKIHKGAPLNTRPLRQGDKHLVYEEAQAPAIFQTILCERRRATTFADDDSI